MFVDESGFSRVCAVKNSWSPVGCTPFVKTSITKHGRINAVGLVIVSPGWQKIRLSMQTHTTNITGEQICDALWHLLDVVKGPICLLWDQNAIHKTAAVKRLIGAHKRLEIYDFPKAAPEVNPTEGVWAQMDEYMASKAMRTTNDLKNEVRKASMRTRNSQKRLWACIAQSRLL